MKILIEELSMVLDKIDAEIKQRKEIAEIDFEDYDELMNINITSDPQENARLLKSRERLFSKQNDKSLWEKDLPALIETLDKAKERIEESIHSASNIGGKDLPNCDISMLIRRGLLTARTLVSKTYKGKTFEGHLTEDGFIEIIYNGAPTRTTLRKAVLLLWHANPSNQWTFWEAKDSSDMMQPLEYFKNLLSE